MNKSEKKIKEKYERLGYKVYKNGFPDFMLFRDGKLEFSEVKYWKDTLKPNQRTVRRLLQECGFKVRLDRVPKVIESPLYKRLHGGIKK